MALHTDLPVYKLTSDLLGMSMSITRHMPKEFKASMGSRISDEIVSMLILIGRANAARNKAPHLDELLEHLHAVQILFRAGHDFWVTKSRRLISTAQYGRAAQVCTRIGRQVGGWRKSTFIPPAA